MVCSSTILDSAAPSTDFSPLTGVLSCPDDGAILHCRSENIECSACRRRFPIANDGVADLRPLRALEIDSNKNGAYWQEYIREFYRPYGSGPNAIAWGAPEIADSGWIRKRLRQVLAVRPLIVDTKISKKQILCDIAAGAGYYTMSYATSFRFVLHCDLSIDNLSYASRKAKRLGIGNVFFLRIDYFWAPFHGSLDRVICFDTLIRGEDHELALLKSIRSTLQRDGRAVVDFHSWWHNPLRRLGLLPQNFGENRSYTRRGAEKILQAAGILQAESFAFHQELAHGSRARHLLVKALPSTRLVYRFRNSHSRVEKQVSQHSSDRMVTSCG
jgi:SAM-dependent methyltransferase